MAKTKTAFFCQNCGTQYPKWIGQCTACKEWNTVVEEVIQKETKSTWTNPAASSSRSKALPLNTITTQTDNRIPLEDQECNRVLGGGLVMGSVTLLGGEPGIGKSTLLLQIALKTALRTLYVSGEESARQIKMRADRIRSGENNCHVLTETNTQQIFHHVANIEPDLLVIDSIQTLQSDQIDAAAGSISQIRVCAAELISYAKETGTPVIVIGHITKDGHIAGPKILEHMVDTVLQLEGDRHHVYRILRVLKNRFGATSELGIYEMLSTGMREVPNPSELLISNPDESLSGMAIACTIEGLRPLMIEIQALVSTAVYGTPQRSTTGFPVKRLNMLLAVLEKRAGFKLGSKDVFLNITGGISIDDPALDLAVVAAILSSNFNIPIPKDHCFAAEVGLAGEIRAVQHSERRIAEAEKLGFSHIYIANKPESSDGKRKIKVDRPGRIEALVEALFG